MTKASNKSIGQYQAVEFVARGDSAFVYKGYQPAMKRYVAIKMLPPSKARDVEAKRNFQRQAELMAQLDHPGILPVYDFGLEGDLPYLVSHFSEGGTLDSRLAQYQKPANALDLMIIIVSALDYLYDQGLIHGNLKPTNILFDSQDRPKLTDIGMNQTDIRGQAFLSPEGAQGGPVDRRSDVYSLGVLLYELMVGQPPQVGVTPHPRQARPDLQAGIESVILMAMAQDPEQRFQSPREFIEALAIAVEAEEAHPLPEGEPETTEPETLVYELPEPDAQKDNRWILMAIAGLVLVVIFWAAVAVLSYTLARDNGEPQPLTGTPLATANSMQSVYSGPGENFSVEGAMIAGQTAQILGVSADGDWWNILFPRAGGGTAWVATNLVTVENIENVPVVESPATPVAMLEESSF